MFKRTVLMTVIMAMAIMSSVSAKTERQLTGVVNINTASASELMLLPGIGKAKADGIIAYRQTTPFKSAQELVKVKGIGEKLLAKMVPYLAIDGATTIKEVKVSSQAGTLQPSQAIKTTPANKAL